MAVRFPEPIHPVDPIELEINQLFDHLIVCLNQRRVALLTTYRDTRAQIAARLIARARKEEELIGLKTDTDARLQMNELRELQERFLAEIEQKLAQVRVPQPETRVVFRGNCGHLEQVIAGVGEVVKVPVVPRIQEMRPIVAVGKRGQAPGELYNPHAVAIDRNSNHIYVAEGARYCNFGRISIFSDGGEFLNSYTHEDMKCPFGIAIHTNNMYVSDVEAHAVFQFKIDSDIRLVAKLGTQGTGNGEFDRMFVWLHSPSGEFNYPSNLAVSTNGDVYVADSRSCGIPILDSSLHYLRTLTEQSTIRGEGGEVGMFYSPTGLTLNNELNLIVLSLNDHYRLQIFSSL